MIKRLQRKFIAVAMISVIVVLIIIMGFINVINHRAITRDIDGILDALSENNGLIVMRNGIGMEDVPLGGENPSRFNDDRKKPPEAVDNPDSDTNQEFNRGIRDMSELKRFGAETAYETRFFTVLINEKGSVVWTNTSNVASVDSKTAAEYALSVYGDKNRGYYKKNYRYKVTKTENSSYLVIFVDCTQRLQAHTHFLKVSIITSLVGIVAIFVLVYILSYQAMKPIAETYEKQKRFITDSNHEIKTPLAVIRANTEVIEMTDGESEWTKSIMNQVDRLTELTRNLTALSRMDEESLNLTKEKMDLSAIVEDKVKEFEVLAKSKGLRLKKNIEPGVVFCGDEPSIRQLVSILLDNACKYAIDYIEVSLYNSKGKINLIVYNKAECVKKGSLDNYFDRFYRGDISHNKEVEGFGIGLSIAASIVVMHKGRISGVSEDGESVKFKVTL